MAVSNPFTRLFESLSKAAKDAIPSTTYEARRVHDSDSDIDVLAIDAHLPEEERVMEGAFYPGGHGTPAYSFRWAVDCTERTFFSALKEIIPVADDREKQGAVCALSVVSASLDEASPLNGLLVFSNVGVFLAPLSDAVHSIARGDAGVDTLRLAIQKTGKKFSKPVEIDALRAVTPLGDFQLDVKDDYAGRREVFVISHVNIGEQITYLRAATGRSQVVPSRLNEAVQTITNTVPRYDAKPDGFTPKS